MAKKLDPKIADVLQKYGHGPESCWDCHGTWVVLHRTLEQIAAQAGIKFDPPQVLEARGIDKVVAICATGTLGDRTEWSIGEAAPGNNKNSYPWAMAEKRAKDRVILKLVGLTGLAYSEDEADDFKASNPTTPTEKNPPGIAAFRQEAREFYRELYACTDYDQYLAFIGQPNVKAFLKKAQTEFPKDWTGDGGDVKGIKEDMRIFCDNLKKTEGQA